MLAGARRPAALQAASRPAALCCLAAKGPPFARPNLPSAGLAAPKRKRHPAEAAASGGGAAAQQQAFGPSTPHQDVRRQKTSVHSRYRFIGRLVAVSPGKGPKACSQPLGRGFSRV